QRPGKAYTFQIALQGRVDPAALTASARSVARELDPQVPTRFRTLTDVVSTSLADRRFVLVLLALFGGLALVLASIGVYGVIAYMAWRRPSWPAGFPPAAPHGSIRWWRCGMSNRRHAASNRGAPSSWGDREGATRSLRAREPRIKGGQPGPQHFGQGHVPPVVRGDVG